MIFEPLSKKGKCSAVDGGAGNKIIKREYLQNPHWQAETKRGFLVGKWLLGFKPDQVLVAREKEGTALALLKEAGIEVLLIKNSDVG